MRRFFHVIAILLSILAIQATDGITSSAWANGGWFNGVGGPYGGSMEACRAQYDHYIGNAGTFIGVQELQGWSVEGCLWNNPPGYTGPGTVYFNCDAGTKQPDGSCALDGQNYQGAGSCSKNNAASLNPGTGHPIEILSGAKVFQAEDFRNANGSLALVRRYRSIAYGASTTMRRIPKSLGRKWQFAFSHEIHISGYFGTYRTVELQTAEGISYRFWLQNNGTFTPNDGVAQTDYTLQLVGSLPPNWDNVPSMQTQWQVKDAEDRIWLFQSFNDPVQGYGVAHPISVTFRGGMQWTFTYGTYNQVTAITDSFGNSITFDWILGDPATIGASGAVKALAISQANLPGGRKVKYTYQAINSAATALPQPDRLIKVEYVDSANTVTDSVGYVYGNASFPDHITGILDNAGSQIWSVTYDANGWATQSSGPGGADSESVSYVPYTTYATTVTRTVTNALSKSSVYTFSRSFQPWVQNEKLTQVDGNASTHCVASTRSWSYNGDFIASTTDEEGRVTSYTRDALGRPTQIIDGYGTPLARTRSITWHSTFNVPTQVVEPGLTTDLTWNSPGQLTQLTETDTTTTSVPYSTNGQTRTWTFTYGTGGLLSSVDGPLPGTGDTTTYTYTSAGFLQTVTDEVGHVTTVTTWDVFGHPTSVTDSNGVVTTYTYDGVGRFTSMTVDPSGIDAVTAVAYNSVGLVSQITKPDGSYLQYTWDSARRVIKAQDNTGAYLEYDRNALGDTTAVRIKDASANLLLSQSQTFDELGRRLTFVGNQGWTWTSAYDKTSNLVSLTDPSSNTRHWAFDSLNRLKQETDQETHAVNLTRNGQDKVTAYTDPRSLATIYVRNGFGEIIQRTSPDTGTTVYEYNELGKTTKITDGRGLVTNLTYDSSGRLLAKTYPAASGENITYTWDSTAGGNNGSGRLTKVEDASGSTERTYDAAGRVIQEKKTVSSVVYTVGYAYDAAGNITEMTYPSGRVVDFGRDALGRISSVTTKKDSGSPTVTLAAWVNYTPFGDLQSLAYGNGLILWKNFDNDYLLYQLIVEQSPNTVINLSFGRWANDAKITNIWDTYLSGRDQTFGYTPTNRLQQADGPWGTFNWSYDETGNRWFESLAQGTTTNSYWYAYPSDSNKVFQMTTETDLVHWFSYDGAGNVIEDWHGPVTPYYYHYNNRGRIDQLTINSTVTATYTYDAREHLVARTTQNMTPAGTTHYVYDLAGHLLMEANDSGTVLREYVWIDDQPLAVMADLDTSTPKLYFVHPDHLNRPIKMTDESQAVVWDAIYQPFGAVYSISGSASLNLRFPGQYFLMESGLHYNWHREYDPAIGRYLQADPLGFVDGPSVYAYAGSTPTTRVDPKGLQSPTTVGPRGITVPPNVYIPGTPENNAWKEQWIKGWQGLFACLRRIAGGSDYDRCMKAANGSTDDWEEFCRGLPDDWNNVVGPQTLRRACWEKTYESKDKKRNWCRNQFGNR